MKKNNNSLEKFDPRFRDLEDYIITITEEIWEGRGLNKIRDYYDKNVVIHTPAGDVRGAEETVRNTAEMLNVFPDRRLLPHDVITSKLPGTGSRKPQYFSSHRIVSTMHHRGKGIYGKPTNNRVVVFTIADCLCYKNQIFREWLVRDNLAIVKQLGLEPRAFAKKMAKRQAKKQASKTAKKANTTKAASTLKAKPITKPARISPLNNIIKQQHLTHLSAKAQADVLAYLQGVTEIRGRGEVSSAAKLYHSAATLFLPGGIMDYGVQGAENFVIPYLGAFSISSFTLEQITACEDRNLPLRIALRWRLRARHTGNGKFGKPTSKDLDILGITHANLHKGKVIAEWNLVDEMAILTELAGA